MTKTETAPKRHACRCRAPGRPPLLPNWYEDARPREDRAGESRAVLEEAVRTRAYEIYCARGRQPGSDLDDWLAAEREILAGR